MAPPRKKKPDESEYRLRIGPTYVEREQKFKILFILETTRLFSNFRYDLSVREEIDSKSFHFKVLGLNPPQLSLPAVGHAQFMRTFDNLHGTYDISVEGLDNKVNTFSVKFTPTKMELVSAPKQPFVELVIEKTPISAD